MRQNKHKVRKHGQVKKAKSYKGKNTGMKFFWRISDVDGSGQKQRNLLLEHPHSVPSQSHNNKKVIFESHVTPLSKGQTRQVDNPFKWDSSIIQGRSRSQHSLDMRKSSCGYAPLCSPCFIPVPIQSSSKTYDAWATTPYARSGSLLWYVGFVYRDSFIEIRLQKLL